MDGHPRGGSVATDPNWHKTADSQKDHYLTFELDGQVFGLALSCVMEISSLPQTTPATGTPPAARGRFTHQGQSLMLWDVRALLGKPVRSPDDSASLVLIETASHRYGLAIDAELEFRVIPARNIAPPPAVEGADRTGREIGNCLLDDRITILLDAERLLLG